MQALRYANEKNSHGFGYAWVDGDEVEWAKGFQSTEFADVVDDFLARPFPKAIHFRLATHGGIQPALTHPFPLKRGNPLTLNGRAKSVLFHNGIWSCWDDRLREAIFGGSIDSNVLRSPMSDSRAMAILAQRFGPDILDLLELHSNKVLIMTDKTWYKYGDWKQGGEGWQASNSSIVPPEGGETLFRGVREISRELPTVYHGPRSQYLSTEREEVERNINLWSEGKYE